MGSTGKEGSYDSANVLSRREQRHGQIWRYNGELFIANYLYNIYYTYTYIDIISIARTRKVFDYFL